MQQLGRPRCHSVKRSVKRHVQCGGVPGSLDCASTAKPVLERHKIAHETGTASDPLNCTQLRQVSFEAEVARKALFPYSGYVPWE